MFEKIIDAAQVMLGQWGALGELLLFFLTRPYYIVALVLGYYAIRWAWNEGKSWALSHPEFWKPLLWSFASAALALFIVVNLPRWAPEIGVAIIENAKQGAAQVDASIDGSAATAQPTIQPTQGSPAPTPQPAQPTPAVNGVPYRVTFPNGGATARDPGADGVCQVTDVELSPIPDGTLIYLRPETIQSDNRALTIDGKCVHLDALTKEP